MGDPKPATSSPDNVTSIVGDGEDWQRSRNRDDELKSPQAAASISTSKRLHPQRKEEDTEIQRHASYPGYFFIWNRDEEEAQGPRLSYQE